MALIEWQDRFRIGVAAIDHEHRALVELINELHAELGKPDAATRVPAFFGDLHAAIGAHFALEEKLMRDRRYAGYAEHKTDHEFLLDEIREIMDAYESGRDRDYAETLAARLEAWFGRHFQTHDARLHRALGDPHP